MRTILRFPGISLIFVGANSRLLAADRSRRRTRAALILSLLLAIPAALQGQFLYVTSNDSIIILGYDGPGGAVTIPNAINSHSVTSIGNFAFAGNTSLTSVKIDAALTVIDFGAFSGCAGLTNFEVNVLNPAYSTLDGVLFNKTQDTLVAFTAGRGGDYSVPNGTTNIGAGAFFGSSSLTNVTLTESVTEIGGRAFEGCTGLESVMLDDGLASIGARAFAGCIGLRNVTIPASVTNVAENFFKFDYRMGSFRGCDGLTNFTVAPYNPTYSSLDGDLFSKSGDRLILCPAAKLGDYIVPSNVTSIAPGALGGCSGLTSVVIPDRVASIENGAFESCSGLTSITLGAGVTNLIGFSFDQYSTPQLTNITVSALNSAYSSLDGVLFSKSKDTLIAYPQAKRGGYSIPSGVISIGAMYDAPPYSPFGSAFTEHSGLTSVTIPDSVTAIADYAFGDCTNLTSATIGNGVASIGRQAFDVCTALASVTIGSAVGTIGHSAFGDCPELRTVFFLGDAPAVDTLAFEAATNAIIYYLPGTSGWRSTFAGRPTALWDLPNPVLLNNSSSLGVQSNGFGFTVSWATNVFVVVEAATNLANPAWTPLQTNALSGGSSYFSDPQWTTYPARFYRIRSP